MSEKNLKNLKKDSLNSVGAAKLVKKQKEEKKMKITEKQMTGQDILFDDKYLFKKADLGALCQNSSKIATARNIKDDLYADPEDHFAKISKNNILCINDKTGKMVAYCHLENFLPILETFATNLKKFANKAF